LKEHFQGATLTLSFPPANVGGDAAKTQTQNIPQRLQKAANDPSCLPLLP
jgi:hypothetical protein